VAVAAWLWKRIEPWKRVQRRRSQFWNYIHKSQLAEIADLRKDVDALLMVIDHWTTPGAGDKQRQFDYMAEILQARGKNGISGAGMRVASLMDTESY
jgi:hypothetical protein